ncbi:MAG: sulfite exporter TauE/SafE family protein, partial [Verrucomicrobiia bacterium]
MNWYSDLTTTQWLLAALAALSVGLAKSGLGGFGMVAVLLMAEVLPARLSTGALLPLLIIADRD